MKCWKECFIWVHFYSHQLHKKPSMKEKQKQNKLNQTTNVLSSTNIVQAINLCYHILILWRSVMLFFERELVVNWSSNGEDWRWWSAFQKPRKMASKSIRGADFVLVYDGIHDDCSCWECFLRLQGMHSEPRPPSQCLHTHSRLQRH